MGPSYGRHEGISAAGVLRARGVRPVGRHPPAAATSKRGHGCQGVWHCSQALPLRHGHHSGSRLPAPRVSCLRLGLTCRMALPVLGMEPVSVALPLLTALPLGQLVLAPRHAGSAESLLRCDAVAAASSASLRRLAATVACTDTLQRYLRLEELHLHAGVLGRLYPAVLHGLSSLRRLGLHGYKEAQLVALPTSVADTLQVKAEAERVGGWVVGWWAIAVALRCLVVAPAQYRTQAALPDSSAIAAQQSLYASSTAPIADIAGSGGGPPARGHALPAQPAAAGWHAPAPPHCARLLQPPAEHQGGIRGVHSYQGAEQVGLPACLPSSLLHSKYDGAVC